MRDARLKTPAKAHLLGLSMPDLVLQVGIGQRSHDELKGASSEIRAQDTN